MGGNHTVFGDLRKGASVVYRVQTQQSTYLVGVHEEGGRRYVVVRGEPGSERENIVLRDTDPRIGSRSLFDVPLAEWIGRQLQVTTMTSSPILAAQVEGDPVLVAMVSGGDPQRVAGYGPPPAGMSHTPAIAQVGVKGTHPGSQALPVQVPAAVHDAKLAREVVVGEHRPELAYPHRHVRHAEDAAALLRSVARRDRIFEDVAFHRDRALLDRLRKALDESAKLIAQIRARDLG